MCPLVNFPGLRGLKFTLAAGVSLLTTDALFAQSADQSDISALKAQMAQMQKQYEQRIDGMEAQMKALQSKADSGSILNTHILTDAEGKGVEEKGVPALDESFLKSLTRNFTFSAYVRAGVQFNGSGGGGNFSFTPPDSDGGRPRLGNENDTYMELTWAQAHLLGDDPNQMDVSMTFTPAIRYVQSRNTFVPGRGNGLANSGNDFDFILRQAFLEMKNVFKSAPDVTFWGGIRFYDRFNYDPADWFWLDTSGYGAGVENIDLGIGKLWVAYLGGLNASEISPTTGSFYKHTLDVRLKDIDIGFGKLMVVGIGNYEKGSTFTQGFDINGNTIDLTNPVKTSQAWGVGGGIVWQYDLPGHNNFVRVFGLAGRGATNFSSGDDLGLVNNAETSFLTLHPGTAPGTTINVGNVINKARTYRAGVDFYINPVDNFSLAFWAFWQNDDNGFINANTVNGVVTSASGSRNLYEVGIRPCFWITDNIAIQGQAVGTYQDNNRVAGANGAGFGRSGSMGVFTFAPTIKPKGGYFTKPELRFFATYSIWSDGLRGVTTPAQEAGSDFTGPYANVGTNQGWLFGTQVEWFF